MQWVGHNYLGPGNELSGKHPVDNDDLLAALHDLAYESGDVSESDKHFAQDFIVEYLQGGHIESLAGAIGLAAKYFGEKITGRLYPMGKIPVQHQHAGHQNYGRMSKNLGAAYREHMGGKKGNKDQWTSFQREWHRTSTGQPSSSSTTEMSQQEIPQEGSMGMDTVDNPEAGGGGGIGSTNMALAENKLWDIPRSLGSGKYTLRFSKTRLFDTYAYIFKQITKVTEQGDNVFWTTPLAQLPNDLLGFYCDPHEIQMLQQIPTKCIHARVTVVPQGARAAFDTGTSLSGTATSEHVLFGITAIGLNKKMYTVGTKYTSQGTNPMIPTDLAQLTPQEMMLKYYGRSFVDGDDNAPMVLGVQRHCDVYTSLKLNSTKTVPGYAKHDEGVYNLDKNVKRFNFKPKCGEKIIDWSYKPINGFITTKSHDIPLVSGQLAGFVDRGLHANLTRIGIIGTDNDGKAEVQPEVERTYVTNTLAANAWSSIDNQMFFHPQHGPNKLSSAVPLLCMGILPVPALNPANDQKNFLNAAATWSVKCELIVENDLDSCFPLTKQSHAYADNVLLRPSGFVQHTGPHHTDIMSLPPVTSGPEYKIKVETVEVPIPQHQKLQMDAPSIPPTIVKQISDEARNIIYHEVNRAEPMATKAELNALASELKNFEEQAYKDFKTTAKVPPKATPQTPIKTTARQ